MSKYIDLGPQVAKGTGGHALTSLGHQWQLKALKWLDDHPDQVPGRTITRTEFNKAFTEWFDERDKARIVGIIERLFGITVIPDPEPTNAGHDRDWWVENANVNDAEDCEACEGDLCPVHYGVSMGIDLMAKKIAALGDDPELFALIPDPVNAPGGDDE